MNVVNRLRGLALAAGLAPTLAAVFALTPRPPGGGHVRPSLYVLAVGVDDYRDEHRLNYAVRDARSVARAFAAGGAGVFGRVEVRLLTDRDADRAGLARGLGWLRDATTPRDTAVFYYAGHSCNELSGGFDLAPGRYRERRWRQTTFTAAEIRRAAESIPGRTVVLLDTCYTGLMIDGRPAPARGPAYLGATRAAEQTGGGDLFTPCDLTRALVGGLGGAADADGDGVVTLGELESFAAGRVAASRGKAQHVVSSLPGSWRAMPLASARP